jgi:hypothetical protein
MPWLRYVLNVGHGWEKRKQGPFHQNQGLLLLCWLGFSGYLALTDFTWGKLEQQF